VPRGYWTLWVTVVVDMIGFGVMAPLLADYAKQYGASGVVTGILMASFSAAQFVFSPILGRLSDRVGRKPVILASLFGSALSAFVGAFATSLVLLFVSRIVNGASGSSVAVAMGAVGDIAEPEDRPRLIGLMSAAFGIGFVIGPAIGALAAFGGDRLPWIVSGAIALINAVVAWVRLPETHGRSQRAPLTLPTGPARRVLLALLSIFLIQTFAFAAIEGMFSRFALDRFGVGKKGTGLMFAIVGVLLTLVQVGLVSKASARMGPWKLAYRSLLVLSAGLLILAGTTEWWQLGLSMVLVCLGSGLFGPTIGVLTTGQTDHTNRGSVLGVQQSVGAAGRIAGPVVAGALLDIRLGLPYLVSGVLVAIAALLAWRARPPDSGTEPDVGRSVAITH
jgi:MFS transporter, DHA1 family, tetracycline resistance protein